MTDARFRKPRQPRGGASIAMRITAWCAVSGTALLAVLVTLPYWMLVSSFDREDNQYLSDTIEIVRSILVQHPGDPVIVRQELREVAIRHAAWFRIRELDRNGKALADSSYTERVPEPNIFPAPSPTLSASHELTDLDANGRSYRIATASIAQKAGGAPRYVVQVALDRSTEVTVLATYRRAVAYLLLLGAALFAAAGYVIARRALRPLSTFTRFVEQIRATHLGNRVAESGWPKELRGLAVTFDKMLERLESSFGRLGRFSADIAHELRTPLNIVRGEAEVVLSKPRTGDEYRQVIESSLDEFTRLSVLVDSLLFLARSENAEPHIVKGQLDAADEMSEVGGFYEALASEGGVALEIRGAARLHADSGLLRRALGNLIANSLRYTRPGGKVALSATQMSDGSVEIEVSDTGTGIAPEHLPHLFDRFYRADSGRERGSAGSGLGLAIVKSIMTLHGGTADVRSEPGKGTRVTLRFPGAGNAAISPSAS